MKRLKKALLIIALILLVLYTVNACIANSCSKQDSTVLPEYFGESVVVEKTIYAFSSFPYHFGFTSFNLSSNTVHAGESVIIGGTAKLSTCGFKPISCTWLSASAVMEEGYVRIVRQDSIPQMVFLYDHSGSPLGWTLSRNLSINP